MLITSALTVPVLSVFAGATNLVNTGSATGNCERSSTISFPGSKATNALALNKGEYVISDTASRVAAPFADANAVWSVAFFYVPQGPILKSIFVDP